MGARVFDPERINGPDSLCFYGHLPAAKDCGPLSNKYPSMGMMEAKKYYRNGRKFNECETL